MTDGTAAGTTLVADINPGSGSSYAYGFTALGNGTALFSANDGTHGYELWVTDGTAAGTTLVDRHLWFWNDLSSYPPTSRHSATASFCSPPMTERMARSCGSPTAPPPAPRWSRTSSPGSGSSNPFGFTALGNGRRCLPPVTIRMAGSFGSPTAPPPAPRWSRTSTPDRAAHSPGASWIADLGHAALGNGSGVFIANDGIHGKELWVTDGTAGRHRAGRGHQPGCGQLVSVRFHRARQRQVSVRRQ